MTRGEERRAPGAAVGGAAPHRGALAAALLAVTVVAAAGAAPARRVLILSPSADDARVELVRESIAFWRDTFAELGLTSPLVEAGVVVALPQVRAIENFAWQISRAAGRLPPGTEGPPPPPELLVLRGDIVVLLSQNGLMPFAWPLPRSERFLVAISRTESPDRVDRGLRNVIAHELGHTVGLSHGDDPGSLMCEPCRTATRTQRTSFAPLTDDDRAHLLELYGSDRVGAP